MPPKKSSKWPENRNSKNRAKLSSGCSAAPGCYLEVRVVLGERDRAAGAPEGPATRHLSYLFIYLFIYLAARPLIYLFIYLATGHLHRRFPGEVRHQEVHGEVLAVGELVYSVPDLLGHDVRVHVAVVLVVERRPRQHHAQLAARGPVIQHFLTSPLHQKI